MVALAFKRSRVAATMFSSRQSTFLGEVLSWVLFAAVTVVCVTHFDELRILAHKIAGTNMERPAAGTAGAGQRDAGGDGALASGYTVELPIGDDGHYHADAEINGRPVRVLVDTGASMIALTAEDADASGIFVKDSDFTHLIQTANGTAKVAPVMLDRVSIGDITVRDVRGVVSEPGALTISLLGMTFLNELDRVDMRSGTLVLQD